MYTTILLYLIIIDKLCNSILFIEKCSEPIAVDR
jgi:hypothetical protein